jgi:hypothetical protein
MITDPYTFAVVMGTGAVVVGGLWVVAGVAVIAYRTHEHRRAARTLATRRNR